MKKINPIKAVKEALGANGVIIIVVAALLLIVINIVQYKFAEDEINEDLRLRALSELSAKSLAIQNIMTEVETAVRNHVEDVSRQIQHPDSMYSVAASLVKQNPVITGSSISFIENFYPSEGKWFEAFAVQNEKGGVDTMQLGGEAHDYFKNEFFTLPLSTGKPVWTNPYLDSDGAKMMLTTYSQPIFNEEGKFIAVLDADISLDWLDDILTVEYAYPSSYHVLLSKTGQLMSVADKNYVMKTIPEMSRDYGNKTFEPLNEGMMSGVSGETLIKDKKGNKYRAFYMPVGGDTGWSIAIINSEKEIFGDFHRMKVTILWLSIGGFLILLLIMLRAIMNIRRLQKVTTEREKIQSELNVAREIQNGMLPKQSILEVADEQVEVAGSLESAKEVGGDLYDYFIKEDYLYFCIGDVSGKGVPAALFMSVTRSLFRTISPYTRDAAKVLSYMNNSLAQLNESNMFVTFLVGILDMKTGRLIYANAGHDAPVILDENGVAELKVTPNLPLGIFPDFEFQSQSVQLRKESLIFLYTDGLTEAMNNRKEEFGEERTMNALKEIYLQSAEISPESLLERISSKIKDFVGNAEQSDDLTMLAFRFHKSDSNPVKNIKLVSDISSITKLNGFVDEFCEENNLSADFSMELKLAIEESIANIISYAYEEGDGEIEVTMKLQPEEVLVEIKDKGKEFDPTAVLEVDTSASLEERGIGGLGIHLLRSLTNSLSYRRANEYNILSFSKSLQK